MPNGHGGVPHYGAPVFLLILWVAVLLNQHREPRDWLLAAACALAVLFGWRLSWHIHMWDAEEYGGAYLSAEDIRLARRRHLAGSLVYAGIGVVVTLAFS